MPDVRCPPGKLTEELIKAGKEGWELVGRTQTHGAVIVFYLLNQHRATHDVPSQICGRV